MDLSAVLDVLHSSIPQESKDTIFRSLLDEENYRRLTEWQRNNEIPEQGEPAQGASSFQRGGKGRTRTIRRTPEQRTEGEDHEESGGELFKRSFIVPSDYKPVIVGPKNASKKDFEKKHVKMATQDLDNGKVKINLESKDHEALIDVIMEIWEKIGKKQKRGEKQLTGEQYEIVSKWNDTQRANFSIRTGCSLTFLKRKPEGYLVTLKAFTREEAEAGFAQIMVDAKNAEGMEHDGDSEDGEDEANSFPPMNILLVGLEAVGKSTLINSLANYLKFKRLDDAKNGTVDIITKAKCTVYDKKSQNHTMELTPTVRRDGDDLEQMPMIYTFNGVVHAQSREIRIIDTLGIPPKGAANDWENIDAVVEAVKKLGEIHAVVLVINAVEENLTHNFMRVVKNLLQRFHRDILRNVLFCFTRAGGNFTQERVHTALKKFTDEMHSKEDMLVHFSNHSSFCFDNKCFADLIGSQQGIDVDLTQATEFWEKSAEQAAKFFEKVLELPVFNAQRVVPTLNLLPLAQQTRPPVAPSEPQAAAQIEQPIPVAAQKNILILGSEGVGKSMFINSLANYAKFCSFDAARQGTLDILAYAKCSVYDKEKNFHELCMDSIVDAGEQAEGCTIYTLNATNLRFAEVKGIPKVGVTISEAEIESYVENVLNSLKEINSVILLFDGTEDRIDVNFDKVVKSLLRQLPPALHSQIIFCLTRSGPNFNEEKLHTSLTKFAQDMNSENVQIRFDRNSNSFCFDNKGFVDLFGAKTVADVDLTHAEEYWNKSAEQAKRLFNKISQCDTVHLAELKAEDEVQQEKVSNTMNPAALALLDSDLERKTVVELWHTPGGRPTAMKIVGKEKWNNFLDLLEESAAHTPQEQLVEEDANDQSEANHDKIEEHTETRTPSQTVVEQNPPPLPTTPPPEDHPENPITLEVRAQIPTQSTQREIEQTQDSTATPESPQKTTKKWFQMLLG